MGQLLILMVSMAAGAAAVALLTVVLMRKLGYFDLEAAWNSQAGPLDRPMLTSIVHWHQTGRDPAEFLYRDNAPQWSRESPEQHVFCG